MAPDPSVQVVALHACGSGDARRGFDRFEAMRGHCTLGRQLLKTINIVGRAGKVRIDIGPGFSASSVSKSRASRPTLPDADLPDGLNNGPSMPS
eukprot:8275607-Alexandrium_andersonii.AAC.1